MLIEAIRRNLDLKELLESRICTQVVDKSDTFVHYDQFPEFHESDKTVSGVFHGSWSDLVSSEEIDQIAFGKK